MLEGLALVFIIWFFLKWAFNIGRQDAEAEAQRQKEAEARRAEIACSWDFGPCDD